jgi:hypothetical protein
MHFLSGFAHRILTPRHRKLTDRTLRSIQPLHHGVIEEDLMPQIVRLRCSDLPAVFSPC